MELNFQDSLNAIRSKYIIKHGYTQIKAIKLDKYKKKTIFAKKS